MLSMSHSILKNIRLTTGRLCFSVVFFSIPWWYCNVSSWYYHIPTDCIYIAQRWVCSPIIISFILLITTLPPVVKVCSELQLHFKTFMCCWRSLLTTNCLNKPQTLAEILQSFNIKVRFKLWQSVCFHLPNCHLEKSHFLILPYSTSMFNWK